MARARPPVQLNEMNVADGSSSVISFWDQALLIEMTNVLPHLVSFAVSLLQQMASGTSASRILEQRRCLLLATLGSTAETVPGNTTLKALLHAGLLVTIKGWLDDILDGKVGGVDLLLHLLTNIIPLPVTKELVTVSKLGKTVSSVEKHKFCLEGANQAAIKSRIQQVKEQWSASVKSLRNGVNGSAKRSYEEDPSSAKRAKPEGSSLSNLLKKVGSSASSPTESTSESKRLKMQERVVAANLKSDELKGSAETGLKKDDRRIRWADNNGQALAVSGEEPINAVSEATTRKSRWSERKKKDMQHEKDLLFKSRKVVSTDHDKNDELDAMAMMAMWRPPQPLPADTAYPPIQIASDEVTAQTNRMVSTPAMRYLSETEIPTSPTFLSEVEMAAEISSRNNATPISIPFFTPQAAIIPPAITSIPGIAPAYPPPQVQPNNLSYSTEATLETVLMMGLPYFLVGSNILALQTLASNPGLLASFKDVNGVYKQPELINLVQTLTQNIAPQASVAAPAYSTYTPVVPTSLPSVTSMVPPPQTIQQSGIRGYRGDQNIGDANLHLSGYGPSTTNDDIRAMFAPYVHVTEIVNKSGFSFVNTDDPEGAKRAREALNGSLLGGLPCRINSATRKARNPNFVPGSSGSGVVSQEGMESLPRNSLGQVDVSQVKDDRGNPATKNLFVAGYGPGTTEQQLKDVFGQFATVVSIVMKGTFCFVNTLDKEAAVVARSSLCGQPLNGGALRINFAKETGRLGTSFDSTYGPAGAPTLGRFG